MLGPPHEVLAVSARYSVVLLLEEALLGALDVVQQDALDDLGEVLFETKGVGVEELAAENRVAVWKLVGFVVVQNCIDGHVLGGREFHDGEVLGASFPVIDYQAFEVVGDVDVD